MHKFPFFKAD